MKIPSFLSSCLLAWMGWKQTQKASLHSPFTPPFLGKPERADLVQRYSSPIIPSLDPIRVSQQKYMHSQHRLDCSNSPLQGLPLSSCGSHCFGRRDQRVASIWEHPTPCTPLCAQQCSSDLRLLLVAFHACSQHPSALTAKGVPAGGLRSAGEQTVLPWVVGEAVPLPFSTHPKHTDGFPNNILKL